MARKTGQAIRDFFIQLGFDGDAVYKGFSNIEKKYKSLQQTMAKEGVKTSKGMMALKKAELDIQKKMADVNTAQHRAAQAELNVLAKKHSVEKMYQKTQVDGIKKVAKTQQDADYLAQKRAGKLTAIGVSRARLFRSLRRTGVSAGLSGTDEYAGYMQRRTEVMGLLKANPQTAAEFKAIDNALTRLRDSQMAVIAKNRELNREFRASTFTMNAMRDSARNLARSYVSMFAVIGGGGMAVAAGQELISIKASLLAATGNANDAAQAFEFVRQTSLGMGTELTTSVKSFSQLGIAAKNAGMSMADTQETFTALAEASAAFGMSTVDQERAFRSVVQMLSKGSVMAEELEFRLAA